MASRDLNAARQAYCDADLEASRAAHTATAAQEQHGGAGSDYLKSIVFGGLDGIITTFAVVATVAGANLDVGIVILMGFSNLFADGISMGFGDYVSSKAEIDFALREQRREQWELENFPEGEEQEMVELYTNRGMSESDATAVIKTFAKYPKLFVDLMMYQELNLIPPDDSASPMKSGLVTFLSFVLFGSIPIWGYVIFEAADHDNASLMFLVSCIMSGVTMFLLGVVKAQFTRQSKWKSGLVMLVNGAIAASAAYLVGWSLDHLITRKPCA